MQEVQYKPAAFYVLDDTSPFQDYSGYARSATITGTEVHGLALTAEATYSQRFHNTVYATLAAPVYVKGNESAPFSITATIAPVAMTTIADQQVASHGTAYDGLTVEGTKVHFTTKYTTGGDARCTYDLGSYRRVDLVGVHTKDKNSLFVNGEMVAEVEISTTQQTSTYLHSDQAFYSGRSSSDQRVLVNNLGFFSRALQPEEIKQIHVANTRRAEGSVPSMYGGEDFFISTDIRRPYLDLTWDDDETWGSGTFFNTVFDGDQLWAQKSNDTTLSGFWITTVDLYNGITASTLNSANLWWEGLNATVEVSIDGETWVSATRGEVLSIIPNGFNPTDKALSIKVSFPAGQTSAYLTNLTLNAYLTNSATYMNRAITYPNAAVTYDEYVPGEMRETWGADLNSGTLTIGADTTSGTAPTVRTVEVWYKKNGTGSPTFSANLNAANTKYLNGAVADPTTSSRGEWAVVHFASNTDLSGAFTIAGDVTVGKVAFYPTTLTLAQITSSIANYTGVDTLRYDGTGSVTVSEPATPASVYAADWEILAS